MSHRTETRHLALGLLITLGFSGGCDGSVIIDADPDPRDQGVTRPHDMRSREGTDLSLPSLDMPRDQSRPPEQDLSSGAPDQAPDLRAITEEMSPPLDMPPPAPDMPAEMLPCDASWSFDPGTLRTSAILTAHYRDTTGHAYIGFSIQGPGTVRGNVARHESMSSPHHWYSAFTVDAGGVYTIAFTRQDGENSPTITVSSCQVRVIGDGSPPPIDAPPTANCQGKVCGDDDSAGGKCTACPMVGSCLDPASPVGPGPGQTPWACLDNAGCVEEQGMCVIWCPSEECRHEDTGGCPQNTENCVVPSWVTSYEEACRMCCESRFHDRPGSPGHNQYACWDDGINLCRYPNECGRPYPQP